MTVRFYKPTLPGTGERDQWSDFASGRTIAETLNSNELRAWVNGREVSATFITHARLKDGVEVYVEPIPKDPVSLAIAASIAAGAAAAASSTAIIVGLTALSIGLSVASSMMAQKKAQNKGSESGSFDRLNSITGTSNQIASFEAIPRLFGRLRYFPPIPMTAKPYTEIKGSDQYLRMLFCLGYGPLELGGVIVGDGYSKMTEATPRAGVLDQPVIRIGATDIAEYEDLEYEIGTPDQMTLYTDQIIETNPGWTTESDASGYDDDSNPTVIDDLSTIRTTETEATGFSLDVAGQIYTTDSKGRFRKIRIEWQVEWRLSGTADVWQSGTFTQSARGTQTSRVNFSREGLTPGQYDVRLTRVSTYFSNLEGPPQSQVTWTALRTLRDRRAFTVANTVVMAIKVRATDQINGTIDKLSVLPTAVVDVYDNGAWVKKPTRAHAWAFASVWTDAANREPIARDDLNLASLLAWEAETNAAGRYYDAILDNNETTLDRINDICAGGRATWTIDPNTSIRVVLDTVQSTPKMLISPRNSSGYTYQMNAYDPPHAVKTRYIDPVSWENTERVVYDDGFDEASATLFETIDAVGCTDADQAWKDGRRYLANRRLRDIEQHAFSQGIQHYKYGVGDLLELAHEVILVSLAYGRIKTVTTDSNGDAVAVLADTFLPMPDAGTPYALKIQRLDGTVVVADVANDAPGNDTATFAAPVSGIEPDCHIVFGEAGKITTDVKVLTITPRGDSAQITCVPAAPNVLDAETGTIPAPPNDITIPPSPGQRPPNTPTISSIVSDGSVALVNDDGSIRYRVAVFVAAHSGRTPTDHIVVQARFSDETRYEQQRATDGAAYFEGFYPGDVLTIRAKAFSRDGLESAWVYVYDYTVTGRVPLPPEGLSITRHTFSADIDPLGGKPGSKYEFFISGVALAPADIETNATRLNQQPASAWTATGLDPDTQYYVHVRAVNIYAASAFVSQGFITKNEAGALLKALDGQLRKTQLFGTLADEINLITDPDTVAGSVNARVQAEAQARADALLTEKNAREAAITNEQTIRQSEDESLAESIAAVSAGTGEQFDVARIWYFDADKAGWTGNLGLTVNDGYLLEATGANPFYISPAGVAVNGDSYRHVKARIRRSGTPAWEGALYWQYPGDSAWRGPATIAEPAFDSNGIATIGFADLAWTGTIEQIRLDLATDHTSSETIELDWAALGRPTPGASTAALQTERTARIDGDSSLASARETLAAQLRGSYTGTDAAQLTQGLVYSERQARVSDTGAIAQDVSNLDATITDPSTGLDSKASSTRVNSVESDAQSARADLSTFLQADYNDKLDTKAAINLSGAVLENGSVVLDPAYGPFAQATKQVTVSDGASTATVEQQFTAARSDIGGLNAQWTIRLQGTASDGTNVYGGFGLGAEGATVNGILDVDTFAVGRVGTAATIPFVFDTANEVALLKGANVQDLVFTKLRDSSGGFVTENGKIQVDYIDVDNLQVNYSAVFGPKPPADADKTSLNTAADTANVNGVLASDLTANDSWTRDYRVNTANPEKLTNKDGTLLSVRNATSLVPFIAVATTLGTSARTKTVARFVWDNGWSVQTLSALGYRSNDPRLYLDGGGDPAIGLYNHAQIYTVEVTVYRGLSALSGKDAADWQNDISGSGKPADNADVTGDNTANDVQTGSGRAVAQHGADVTGSNSSKSIYVPDTRADNQPPSWYYSNYPKQVVSEFKQQDAIGVPVNSLYVTLLTKVPWIDSSGGAVIQEVAYGNTGLWSRSGTGSSWGAWDNRGYHAKNTTDDWTRPNTTRIDGNKIFTGDAYVDTLQIKGQAVTQPSLSVSNTDYNLSDGVYKRVLSKYRSPSQVKGSSAQVTITGVYNANANGGAIIDVRLSRGNTVIFEANVVDTTTNNSAASGSYSIPVLDSGLSVNNAVTYLFDVKIRVFGSASARQHLYQSIGFVGLWR